MIRIKEIREDGTYVYEADTPEEERLFKKILEDAFKLAYDEGYRDGHDHAKGECLVKLRKYQDQLLSRGIAPIII